MGNAYEIYALRYATMQRTPHMNFLSPDPHETSAQDLDYFVWLIRGGERDIVVDTGFNAEEASVRGRKLTLSPVDALAGFGVRAENIRDIIVTHLHYDHAGNLDRFPNARFHLQDREMAYATGRCMCNGLLRHPFTVEHVTQMVRHVYGERVTFHSGDGEVAPGVTVHRVGGHSDGLQVVQIALLCKPAQAEPVSDRLQCRRHGRGLGDRRAARRSSRPIHPGSRPDCRGDLSARERQGRRLRPAQGAVALVRQVRDPRGA
jgi:hypothetical protein